MSFPKQGNNKMNIAQPDQSKLNEELEEALFSWEEDRQSLNILNLEAILQAHPELQKALPKAIQELQEMDWLLLAETDESPEEERTLIREPGTSRIQPGPCGLPGYTMIQKIGKGGFGEVWEATGPGGLPVAMKIVPLDQGLEAVELRSLELFKGIHHPHLISIFGYWISHEHLWIAMELADGDFLDYVTREKPSLEKILGMFREAAEAIDFLNQKQHSCNQDEKVSILHRDIQPRNMLIVGGAIKIGDFGLARILNECQNEHSGCMTPSYAPPEFFHGAMSGTSDQYSLAASYCKLRGGQPPFSGSSAEVMGGHCNREPDLSMLPVQERAAVARALEKNPLKRWKSCGDFIEALQLDAFLPPKPPSKKSKLLIPTAVAAAMALLVLLPVFFFGNKPTGRFHETILSGHKGTVMCVAISADGDIGISGSEDKNVIVWDLKNKVAKWILKNHLGNIFSVAISKDKKFALTGGEVNDPRILLWNLDTGELARELTGHQHLVRDLRFLPDGKTAISTSYDCTVRKWDLETGKELFRFQGLDTYAADNLRIGSRRQVWQAAITDNSETLVCCLRDGTVRTYDVNTGHELSKQLGPEFVTRAFSMDGPGSQCVTAYGGTTMGMRRPFNPRIILWNLIDKTDKDLDENHQETDCLYMTPDGKKVYLFSNQNAPTLYDLDSGKKTNVLESLAGKVFSVAGSKAGKRLILGCKDNMVRMVDLEER